MLRCVVPFQFGGNASGLLGREALVQASHRMRVQVVGDQDDALGSREVFFHQLAQLLSQVVTRVALGYAYFAPPAQRRHGQEQVGGAVPMDS